MKKRLLAMLLVVVMVATLLPVTASAAVPTASNLEVTEAIPCKYDRVRYFSDGLAAVGIWETENNGSSHLKWGFIDKNGREVIPLEYEEVNSFVGGFATVAKGRGPNNEYQEGDLIGIGVIDRTGREVIPCKYEVRIDFSEGLALVQGEYYGFVDLTGQKVIDTSKYQYVETFSNGLARVKSEEMKYGYIDKTGKEIVPCKYDNAASFVDGLAAVKINGKWGIIDTEGKEVVPCTLEYGNVEPFSEGFARVNSGSGYYGKIGFIDKTGQELVACKYAYPSRQGYTMVYGGGFREGLAVVMTAIDSGEKNEYGNTIMTELYGFIDGTGQEVVPCQYEAVRDFSEGLAAVKQNGKWGYIDQTGRVVIHCQYANVYDFSEGLAVVKEGDKWGYIDKTGTEVVPCKYEEAQSVSEGLAAIELDGQWGFLAISGYSPNTAQSGVLTGKNGKSVAWSITETGKLSVTGDLAPKEKVLVGCYDMDGRFTGVKWLDAQHATAQIDPATPNVKLFWLSSSSKPLSPSATVWGK